MQVKSGGFSGYRTERQWALRGYLPTAGAQGVELWANPYCQASFVYFSPEEVSPASKEQILAFFEPERDRRNQRERDRRRRISDTTGAAGQRVRTIVWRIALRRCLCMKNCGM